VNRRGLALVVLWFAVVVWLLTREPVLEFLDKLFLG